MNSYNMLQLFPIVVQESNLGRELTKEEKSILMSAPTYENKGNLSSKNSYLLEIPELATLKAEFTAAVKNYMDTIICANPNISAYITQSWTNYTTKNQYHHSHSHKNSYLSGVFYVEAVDGVDKITFYNSRESEFDLSPIKFNVFNSSSWWYPVKTGALLIFPSYLHHSVDKKNESNLRVSLAFNTFLRGTLGDNLTSSELIL